MKQAGLSRRERQIMDLLYANGKLSARAVLEKISDPPTYATVRSLLRILEEKGQVQHEKVGRQFIYEPVTKAEGIRDKSLRHTLKTFFGGSISKAVATFIDDPESELSETELEELSKIIAAAKRKETETK